MAGRYELSPCAACAGKDSKIFGGFVKKANQLPLVLVGNHDLSLLPLIPSKNHPPHDLVGFRKFIFCIRLMHGGGKGVKDVARCYSLLRRKLWRALKAA